MVCSNVSMQVVGRRSAPVKMQSLSTISRQVLGIWACTACWKLSPRLEIRGRGMHPPPEGCKKRKEKVLGGAGPDEGCLL